MSVCIHKCIYICVYVHTCTHTYIPVNEPQALTHTLRIYTFIHKYITDEKHTFTYVKLATSVEGDSKAPFTIATTPRCWKGATPFPRLLHFILDPYFIMQGGIKYHFLSLWYDPTWD